MMEVQKVKDINQTGVKETRVWFLCDGRARHGYPTSKLTGFNELGKKTEAREPKRRNN